jgi:predicted nuclease with TOPRIM domain
MHDCQKQEIINDIKRDIDNLYAIKDVVIRLETLVTMQSEQNKKHDEIINKQSETLTKINDSLSQQSEILKKLDDKYVELDNRFVQNSIDELRRSSISFNTIIRTFIDKALPPIVIAGLTYIVINLVNK